MKIKSLILSIIFASIMCIGYAGCASADGSPRWYNNIPKSLVKYYGTGSAKLQSEEKSRKLAAMRARQDLAAQIQSLMQGYATDYYQQNSETANPQVLGFVEDLTRQILNVQLKYTRNEKIEKSKNGTIYALVSLSKVNLNKALREETKRMKLKIKQAEAQGKNDKVQSESVKVIQYFIDNEEPQE